MSRPARRATVATRRGGRTVRAERGDRSASTAARSRRAPAGPGCGRPRGDDPELEPAAQEDRLGRWAMSLTLINVSTRRFDRAVRLPEGDVPAPSGSRVFEVGGLAEVCGVVGGAAGRLHGCRSVRAPPSVEIDALHLGDDLVLVDAIGVNGRQQASAGAGGRSDRERRNGSGHAGQRGLARAARPTVPRLFIVDGAKVLSKGSAAPSVRPPRSSAARSTRRAKSRNTCRKSIMRPHVACSARPGSSMSTRLKN